MKNLLLTEDGQKNISIMKICVNDVQKLCEFRDIFIQNGYREFYDDSVHYGYEDDYRDFFCDSKNGFVYFRNFVDYNNSLDPQGRWMIGYKERVISHAYINLVNLLSSILGTLNLEDYDDVYTQAFISQDIFKKCNFDKAWTTYFYTILGDMKQNGGFSEEYNIFMYLFESGVLSIETVCEFSREEVIKKRVFSGLSVEDIHQLAINSKFASDVQVLLSGNKRIKKNSY